MYTHCPECNTAFRITTKQLRMGQGRVMCSKCGTLFDAISSLSDIAFEDHYADFRKLPTLPLEQSLTPAFNEEAQEKTEVGPTPSRYDDSPSGTPSIRSRWWSGIVLMVVVMIFQVGFFEGDQLVQQPELRPWLEEVCGYLRCELPAYRDPSEIEVLEKSLQTVDPDALEFRLVMINGSHYPQALPRLRLDFLKFNGEILARRVFLPEEYFSGTAAVPSRMPAGKIFEIRLEVVKPKEDIGGFRFRLI